MGRQRKRKKRGPSIASRANKHDLYQRSVQVPETDVAYFASTYQSLRGRAPTMLREDFCGTANLAVTWCASDPARKAIGIDLDEPTLAWGREHNLGPKADEVGDRLQLVHADVLEAEVEPADIVCAMNFSYCVFKKRALLRRYLERVREGLAEGGLVFLEIYGGPEAIDEREEDPRRVDGFDYVWEQKKFDAITNETLCHIHFRFDDGSKLDEAFTYDWRLWSVPELTDLLEEVGYSKVRVYFQEMEEDEDDPGSLTGTGDYVEVATAEQQDSWLAYVVGER